jgi:hypothetical protein
MDGTAVSLRRGGSLAAEEARWLDRTSSAEYLRIQLCPLGFRSGDLVAANYAGRVQEPDAQTRDRADPLAVLLDVREPLHSALADVLDTARAKALQPTDTSGSSELPKENVPGTLQQTA